MYFYISTLAILLQISYTNQISSQTYTWQRKSAPPVLLPNLRLPARLRVLARVQ